MDASLAHLCTFKHALSHRLVLGPSPVHSWDIAAKERIGAEVQEGEIE